MQANENGRPSQVKSVLGARVLHRPSRCAAIVLKFILLNTISDCWSQQIAAKVDEGEAIPQDVVMLLKQLSAETIRSDTNYLGRVRIRVSPDKKTITYDLTPVPLRDVLSTNDPLAVPLEAFLRVSALRRDFGRTLKDESFWVSSLDSADNSARKAVENAVNSADHYYKQHANQDSQNIEKSFQLLEQSICSYAARVGLEVDGPRGLVRYYDVEIVAKPPRVRLRYMTYLAYRKNLYFKTPLKDQLNDLSLGKHQMLGRYFWQADWPQDLGGDEQGNLDIQTDCTVTFQPPKK